MKLNPVHGGSPALDRLEDAVHLLRATPARDHLVWLLGSGSFALGLLYFWTDQSRSITAGDRLPMSALGLALLFLGARLSQAIFSERLHARLSGATASPAGPGVRAMRRMMVSLIAWQAPALALLPFALLLVFPFPSFLAFQQGLIATAHRSEGSPWRNLSLACRQAVHGAQQTSRETSLLALVWLVLLVNTGVLLYTLPQLAKLLLGVESAFTLNPLAALNTTFLASVFVIATLLADPLVKAVAVLRDFELESQTTGADLLAGLRRIPLTSTLGLLLLLTATGFPARAATPELSQEPSRPHGIPVKPADLNRAITEVLERPQFTWRESRPETVEVEGAGDRSFWKRWLAAMSRFAQDLGRRLESPIKAITDWIGRLLGNKTPPAAAPVKLDFSGFVEFLMWFLMAGGAAVLAVVGIRLWQQRRTPDIASMLPVASPPDLEAGDVPADQLPEDGWLALSRDLAGRGEHRLALRALYLACLSGLAAQDRLRLGRARSNRDYELEVRRRTRDHPQVGETFSEIVRVFERSWYGGRPVTPARYQDVAAAVERLRAP